jgi:hypothetical protein
MVASYATVTDLCRFMNILGNVPDLTIIGSDRTKELVGTGSTAVSRYFLDYPNVISITELNYGTTESESNTALTSGDYILTQDDGKIILGSTAVTAIGTKNIYAAYTYNKLGLSNTQLQDALDRAQDEIDEDTGTHFALSTDATPDYSQVTNELHDGLGHYNRDYFLQFYPIPSFTITTSSGVTTASTSIPVSSTNGFPSSGYLAIETDKVTYTGKTSTAFTGCSIGATHASGSTIYPIVIEISNTEQGTTPVWQVLTENDQYDIDRETGRITISGDFYQPTTYYANSVPAKGVPNRFRATYLYGYDTIKNDIKRATLMIAAKDLLHTTHRKNTLEGMKVENSIKIDEEWIEQTLKGYRNIRSFNI